ncbi:MAG: SEC-C domain-containing protein [Elusimicrobia bacterium]|nr:SEC-C domain-containing protein [Elusimicrobiota bacterium]
MDIARNAPCPCGSGRKHKKCCLPPESASGALPDVDGSLRRKIMNFVQALDHNHKYIAQAQERWGTNIAGAPEEKDGRFLDFMDYFVHDFPFPPSGRFLLDLFLDARGRSLPAEELALLTGWLKNWKSFFEVSAVDPGAALRLKDLVTGEEYAVNSKNASRQLHTWDMIYRHLAKRQGRDPRLRPRRPRGDAGKSAGGRGAGLLEGCRCRPQLFYRGDGRPTARPGRGHLDTGVGHPHRRCVRRDGWRGGSAPPGGHGRLLKGGRIQRQAGRARVQLAPRWAGAAGRRRRRQHPGHSDPHLDRAFFFLPVPRKDGRLDGASGGAPGLLGPPQNLPTNPFEGAGREDGGAGKRCSSQGARGSNHRQTPGRALPPLAGPARAGLERPDPASSRRRSRHAASLGRTAQGLREQRGAAKPGRPSGLRDREIARRIISRRAGRPGRGENHGNRLDPEAIQSSRQSRLHGRLAGQLPARPRGHRQGVSGCERTRVFARQGCGTGSLRGERHGAGPGAAYRGI